jgi:hypothetical protein
LKHAAGALENVPESEKDWHPGSDGQVLDLVHPSLYCVVYRRTHAYLPNKPRTPENFLLVSAPILPEDDEDQEEWTLSQRFCWMPSDFSVLANGSVKLVSPYINNLHPTKHQAFYSTIEDIVAGFVPMFERVLGEIDKERVAESTSGRIQNLVCVWEDVEYTFADEEGEDDEQKYNSLDSKKRLPEADTYAGQLEKSLAPVSLRGRTIQCIIKLANIHLTPEQPKYDGGSWHVEGSLIHLFLVLTLNLP